MADWYYISNIPLNRTDTTISNTVEGTVRYVPVISGSENTSQKDLIEETNVFQLVRTPYGEYGFNAVILRTYPVDGSYSCLYIYSVSASYKQGNVSMCMVLGDTPLYELLVSVGATLVKCNTISKKRRIKSLQSSITGYTPFTLSDRYYTHYSADIWYPMFNVSINDVYYKYLALNVTGTYGYSSGFSGGNISYNTSSIRRYDENLDLSTFTFAVGDVLDFGETEQPILPGWYDFINDNSEPVYTNTYSVISNDNSVLASVENCPPISSYSLTYISNQRQLMLHGINGVSYTLEWSNEAPTGKEFIGLAYQKDSQNTNLVLGNDINIVINQSIVFYEVYGTYRPPATTFDIQLFRNSAEPNRVKKAPYLTDVGTIRGVFRESTSIIDLILTIEYQGVPNFNYVYIEAFNRYYFVDNIISLTNKLWEIHLSVDVLMSYKDAILELNAFVDRNENEHNPYIIDKKRTIEQGVNVTVYPIDNEVFNKNDGLFIPEQAIRFVLNGYKLNSVDTPLPQESEVE